jgi:hypothetical protein
LIRHPVPYWIPAEVYPPQAGGNDGIRVFCRRINNTRAYLRNGVDNHKEVMMVFMGKKERSCPYFGRE